MATEFDIIGNVKVNTQQATQELNSFVNQTNTPRMSESLSSMQQIQNGNLNENVDVLTENFSVLKDEIRKVLDGFKSLCTTLDDTEKSIQVIMLNLEKMVGMEVVLVVQEVKM